MKVQNFTLNPSFQNLNNLSPANLQEVINILQSNSDISACLSDCSNHGICKFSKNQTYVCECNEFFKGKSCQTDQRPCSTQMNKCLNNGTCVNSANLTSFSCECPLNGLYYGQYCENMRNLCENVTCSEHGNCIQNKNETKCKCFKGFEGDECEVESSSIKLVKNFQWSSTIICIVCIVSFWIVIIGSDLLDYFKMGHEQIDINEWKREKLYGEKKDNSKLKNSGNIKLQKQRFQYVPWEKTNWEKKILHKIIL